jgi:anti-sigma regulatory factor (Ser/Thr protein kinase)
MESRVVLPRDPGSVRRARTFARDVVEQWDAPVDVGTVELATSEVVTNALVYGASDVAVTVRVDGDTVRVEVADDSPRLPVVRHVTPDTTSGRGLDIVEAVTERWGVEDIPDDGKVVWFTVAANSNSTDTAGSG